MIEVRLKRIYETPEEDDGRRYLVERLWPRGVSKEKARLAGWFKDVAPSAELRRWYDHDPAKWPEFRLRYFSELEAGRESLAPPPGRRGGRPRHPRFRDERARLLLRGGAQGIPGRPGAALSPVQS